MPNNSIIFFVGKLQVGGAGRMANYFANKSKNQFDKVIIVSLYEKFNEKLESNDIEYKGLNLSTSSKLWRCKALIGIRSQIKKSKPDVVCAFVSDVAVMARIASLFLRQIVFVSAERGDPYTLPFIWRKLVSWAYKHSDYCLFQLPKARDFFSNKIIEKSFVIPNPYIGNPPQPFTGKRRKTIVTATRFEKEKGVDLLIDAFAVIHKKYPEYRLILYGDGSLKNNLHNQVDMLGIADYVEFPGYLQNIADRVKQEGIFVLPSRYEGIPNTLIEVMAIGMPTISADCSPGGPRFLTNNGEFGLLFPVNDKASLINKIELLINNTFLGHQLELLSPRILDFVSEDVIIPLWISFLQTISNYSD